MCLKARFKVYIRLFLIMTVVNAIYVFSIRFGGRIQGPDMVRRIPISKRTIMNRLLSAGTAILSNVKPLNTIVGLPTWKDPVETAGRECNVEATLPPPYSS